MLPSIPIPPAQGKSSLAPYKQNMKKSWTSNSRWAQEAEGRVDHKYAFPHTCCRGPRPHIRGSPSRIKSIATGKHHLLLHNRPSLISQPFASAARLQKSDERVCYRSRFRLQPRSQSVPLSRAYGGMQAQMQLLRQQGGSAMGYGTDDFEVEPSSCNPGPTTANALLQFRFPFILYPFSFLLREDLLTRINMPPGFAGGSGQQHGLPPLP